MTTPSYLRSIEAREAGCYGRGGGFYGGRQMSYKPSWVAKAEQDAIIASTENTIARLRQERDYYREEAQDWHKEATAAINALNAERALVARLVEAAEAARDWPWLDEGDPDYERQHNELCQALDALNRKED